MAWRSSGTTNDEMVDNLKRFGVISSEAVEQGFRNVDRKFFVPKGREDIAHADQPLKEGNVHISAPHIYGSALEALELRQNSSLSFLNVGSGTGYVTCIVASILGPKSSCHGVEIHEDVVNHSKSAIARWQATQTEMPHMQVIHGNALYISKNKGESAMGFDRIYIGASVERTNLSKLTSLLKPGGVLVGPVDDELVKVVRIGKTGEDTMDTDDFSQQVLSGVRFAPLLNTPRLETIIPARVWEPSVHHLYPDSFRKASKALLMCSNAQYLQSDDSRFTNPRVNLAAVLPRVIWMEILSFTHRDWFEPPESDESFLRQRLLEEQENARKAHLARMEAEARCHIAERERDVYRLLARRWQSQLQDLLRQQRENNGSGESNSNNNNSSANEDTTSLILSGREQAVIFGLGAMLRGFQSDSDDDEIDSDNEQQQQQQGQNEMDAEEMSHGEEQEGQIFTESAAANDNSNDEDSDDDANYAFSEDETERQSNALEKSRTPPARTITLRPQVRAVSLSADDY
eukprot:CAMPEP_0116841026 /NCGR_PEP_ID=MMETSP0418-20121206/10691_1 /TAXON_ID=1158023 /ORGANISM="Astrosyne radiata, Strain 13vi08-1A" /LENGTH=516 /DNA_ID=CAMNT_0004471397 /DNA_START=64 /DNA_END=1614 /DNA_ORIENTATION=+